MRLQITILWSANKRTEGFINTPIQLIMFYVKLMAYGGMILYNFNKRELQWINQHLLVNYKFLVVVSKASYQRYLEYPMLRLPVDFLSRDIFTNQSWCIDNSIKHELVRQSIKINRWILTIFSTKVDINGRALFTEVWVGLVLEIEIYSGSNLRRLRSSAWRSITDI